jgi:hypothetical protein
LATAEQLNLAFELVQQRLPGVLQDMLCGLRVNDAHARHRGATATRSRTLGDLASVNVSQMLKAAIH